MTSDYLLISLARRRLWWGSRPRAWPVSQLQTSVLGMIAVRLAVPAAHEQRESVVKGAAPVGQSLQKIGAGSELARACGSSATLRQLKLAPMRTRMATSSLSWEPAIGPGPTVDSAVVWKERAFP